MVPLGDYLISGEVPKNSFNCRLKLAPKSVKKWKSDTFILFIIKQPADFKVI